MKCNELYFEEKIRNRIETYLDRIIQMHFIEQKEGFIFDDETQLYQEPVLDY